MIHKLKEKNQLKSIIFPIKAIIINSTHKNPQIYTTPLIKQINNLVERRRRQTTATKKKSLTDYSHNEN